MKTLFRCAAMVIAALSLVGCSSLDDLRVTNHYPFAIELRRGSERVGTVAPGATDTFDNQGGRRGNADEQIECVGQGKMLGTLDKVGHDIQRESNGSINGSGVLVVVLGP